MSKYMEQKVAYELSVIKCNNMLLGWNYWNCRYIETILQKTVLSKPLIFASPTTI